MADKLKNRRVVSRLSKYKNTLNRFKELGFEKIFSDYLAEEVGVTSSQVRKDFSIFGIRGNKRAGYKIDELLEKLNTLFHKQEVQNVAIIGFGRLGVALSQYKGFVGNNVEISVAFDIDPTKQNDKSTPPIYALDKLEEVIQKENIEIAIIAVPELAAESTYKRLVEVGIKGILNFAPIPLKSTENCIVNSYCVEAEMDNLIYFVKSKEAIDEE
jgi:redox-sensing transcriptional repressor